MNNFGAGKQAHQVFIDTDNGIQGSSHIMVDGLKIQILISLFYLLGLVLSQVTYVLYLYQSKRLTLLLDDF